MHNTDFYRAKQQEAEHERSDARKRLRQTIVMRLLVFALMAWFIYLAVAANAWFILAVTGSLFVFLWLMKAYARNTFRHDFANRMHHIASAGTSPFYRQAYGEAYEDPSHPYSGDFDILGKGSLFHYLNKTETVNGERFLAKLLLNPLTKAAAIIRQQQAVKELASKPHFLVGFRTYSALVGYNEPADTQLRKWLAMPSSFASGRLVPVLLWLVPVFSVAAIATAILLRYYQPLGFAILLNWLIAGIYLKRTNQLHALVGKQKSMLEHFSRLNALVSGEAFASQNLLSLRESYRQSNKALEHLSRLAATFDQRLNTMLGPVLNSFFLFDLQCVHRIEKWKEKNAALMLKWLDDSAEMEALVTLGCYAFDHETFIFPEPGQEGIRFEATGMVHPLIGDKKGVSNSFRFDETSKVFIITGSNMSGKSTFLRTLGVSLLTGMLGLPVNAARLVFSPVRLLSSMRIADSLQDSTSYFHAELKRLKRIMDETDKPGIPAVLFIDEMLKGTNSKEKLDGSVSVIEKLITKRCVSFIATHDLALGTLEQRFPGVVKNYSFESAFINEELVFDYTIKTGVASSTNATFLLKKLEIV